jgi:protein-S-isoprenylcysteine O-methyltransferase Ste14
MVNRHEVIIMKQASIVATIVLVCSVLTLLFRQSLFGATPFPIGIQVIAVGLMIWARLTFGRRSFHMSANPTPGGLITSGPYRFIRHPIYTAILLFLWPGALSQGGVIDWVLAGIATIGIGFRIYAEESLVVVEYPEYVDYAKRTKRIIPFIW